MNPVELMTIWSKTGKIPTLNAEQLNHFYASLEVLAKILATENITVNFSSDLLVNSSHNGEFDLNNRILSIAPFGDELLHTLPGITAHEIGHALFTHYTDDVKAFINENGVIDIWNIIEDGYCERQICIKFIGVKKYLRLRFEEIFLKHWGSKSVNFLTDITNTLNYRCKGAKYGLELPSYPEGLTVEELQELHDAENCNDHSTMDRIERSLRLMKMLNIANERKKQNVEPEKNQEHEDEIGTDGCADDEIDSLTDVIEEALDEKDIEDIIEQFSNEVSGTDIVNEDEELAKMRLQSGVNARKSIYKLASYQDLIELFPTHDIMELCGTSGISSYGLPESLKTTKKFKSIMKQFRNSNIDAQNNAQLLFRKFLSKANAENLKRTNYRVTGTLDPVRLTMYKIFDDVFQQTRILPNQINHGFVVMLDWSGSMQSSTLALIHRVMELAHFALLAKIELEVWLYTDFEKAITSKKFKNEDIIKRENVILHTPKIIHVLSTKINSKQEIVNRLINLHFAGTTNEWRNVTAFADIPASDKRSLVKYEKLMNQRGTTILEAAIFANGRLKQMKSQKRSLVLMTDGSDNDFNCVIGIHPEKLENRSGEDKLSHISSSDILVNGVSIFNLIAKELENYKQLLENHLSYEEVSKTIQTLLGTPRLTALRAFIEVMKQHAIDVTVLGWDLRDEKCDKLSVFNFSLGGEVINIKQDISINASRTRHVGRYTHIHNTFIDELCKRLIGDIYKT